MTTQRADSERAAALREPRRDSCEFLLFGLSGRQASQWAGDLPLANALAAAQQLEAALAALDRVDIAPALHFEILEALRPAVHTALSALPRFYLNQPIVLPPEPARAARLAQQLCQLMSGAYTRVGTRNSRRRWSMSSAGYTRLVCQALHRAISAAGLKLLLNCQLYLPLERNAWADLHQLFVLAQRRQLARHVVADEIGGDGTITAAWLRALLLACCKPNQLRQRDLAAVYRHLGEWVQHVQLLPADAAGLFLVDGSGAQPPLYAALCHGAAGPDCWRLDTAGLLARLQQALRQDYRPPRQNTPQPDETAQQDSAESAQTAAQDAALAPAVLEHLRSAWGEMTARHFTRSAAVGEVRIALGLSNTHYQVAGEVSFARLLAAADSSTATDAGADGQRPPGSLAGAAGPARLVNSSPGGYCLEWSADDSSHVKIGDVMALREGANRHWHIAVIRWMNRIDAQTIRLGAALLSPEAIPCGARLKRVAGEDGAVLRALLLPGVKLAGQSDTLITPRAGFREGQKVTLLRRAGAASSIRLLGTVSATAAYTQFEFRHIQELDEVAARASSALVTTRFESIWNKL